jgi:hypothetical protein
LDNFLEQETTPVFTTIAVAVTVLGWVFIVMFLLYKPFGWAGLLSSLLILVVASLFNAVIGAIAFYRGEYCGGRVATLGIVIWFWTYAVLY